MKNHQNPFSELEALSRILFNELALPGATRCHRQESNYPRINLYEVDHQIRVQALVPGADGEHLDIAILGQELRITGKLPLPLEGEEVKARHKNERVGGDFSRALELPAAVDADKVEATYDRGILEIVLPKAESAKPRQIKVCLN